MKNKIIVAVVLISGLLLAANLFAENTEDKKSDIVNITAKTYDAEIAKGVVIVDFWAAWCPPCRKMNPILEQVAAENKGEIKVTKLDIDDEKAFATKMGIKSIPTIIVYKDGKEQGKIIGVVTKEELVSKIKAYTKE